ncbi:MAG TPA: MGMT family protein [Vitreimonas sp.]|nr:MGMT family protein [Vitreimonas sp.]
MLTPEMHHQVFEILTQIPRGKVATYKQIALLVGLKNARHVGRILHHNPDADKYPCHRVIRSDGHVADGYAFGERFGQIVKLRQEGVVIAGHKVDLTQFQWQPSA